MFNADSAHEDIFAGLGDDGVDPSAHIGDNFNGASESTFGTNLK